MRWYSARVVDNDDPDKLFRLKLEIPDLYGSAPTPDWVPAVDAAGLWRVPPIDAVIVVAEDAGRLRWCGKTAGSKNPAPGDVTEGYPARSGFFSSAGDARLVFEDGDSAKAWVIAPEVRLASGTSASVQPPLLGDDFLADYQTFREGISAFITSCTSVTLAPQVATAATTAQLAIASVVSPGGAVSNYKARVARVE